MKEIIASAFLVVLVILLLNPLHLWMPTNIQMLLLAAAVAAFGVVAAFVLREGAADEREHAHRNVAGRWAFLFGSATIVLGISVQSLDHALDPWLVIVLVVMVLAKMGARFYGDKYL